MTDDPAPLALAVAALIACAWLWLALELRHMRRRLNRHADRLRTHHSTLVAHGAALASHLPTTAHQPMPTVGRGRPLATGGIIKPGGYYLAGESDRDCRPPSALPPARQPMSDIEQALADSPRPLTATELAKILGVMTWDLLPRLDPLLKAGRVEFAPSRTQGQAAYKLAGDTVRLPTPHPPARPEYAR